MYDSLIRFLQGQIDLQNQVVEQQRRVIDNMHDFLKGLNTGTPQQEVDKHSDMQLTFRHGSFSLWEHPRVISDSIVSSSSSLTPSTAWTIIDNTETGGNVKVASGPTKNDEEGLTMKYITKRSDGRYCARKTVNGERICVYGRTQDEAKKKLQAVIGKRSYTKKGSMTLDQWALLWLETYKKGNITDKTYGCYLSAIKAHITLKMPLCKISAMDLQLLINGMPLTKQRKEVYKLIRQIFRKAYELDYVKKDVSEFLSLGKVVEKSREALNLEEQQLLWNALGNDMFSRRVKFYLLTGARPSEIATVRKEELRPGWVKINGTKTVNAVRWVKISQRLYEMLQGESPEFFNFDAKRFRQRLQRLCLSCKIEKQIDVYTLRHTFATDLYILRVPEKDRQVYMGHSAGSSITNAVYTTFTPDTKPQDIYNIFGDWLPEF